MRAALAIGCLIAMAACRTTEVTREDPDPPIDCITIGRPALSPETAKLRLGDTLRVTANMGTPPCGPLIIPEFRWSSSDTSIAAVDSIAGLVRARKQGITTIIARVALDRTLAGAMVVEVLP